MHHFYKKLLIAYCVFFRISYFEAIRNCSMIEATPKFKPNAYTALVKWISLVLHLCGIPDIWVEPLPLSENFLKNHKAVNYIMEITTGMFVFILLTSFITQKDLTVYQATDQKVYNVWYAIFYFYCSVFSWHRKRYRQVIYTLTVTLKQEMNHPVVEKQMIKKFTVYTIACWGVGTLSMFTYIYFGLKHVKEGYPFITLITVWPDVHDPSTIAAVARIIIYIFWVISFLRLTCCVLLYLLALICIAHQYKNLQQYFSSLKSIFDETTSHEEKEIKYERAFVRGLKMHILTIWCTNEVKHICRFIFNAQMLLATVHFISLMSVILDSESSHSSKLWYIPMVVICLISTGCSMWNAGDISVEALRLPDAMYDSGWENCRGQRSRRIRKLIVVAINQAQQPVVLKALGFIELSYASYVAILKTSYSVFSVFY